MSSTITLIFRTPFKTLIKEEVKWLMVTTAAGCIKILPGHATLTDHIPYSLVKFEGQNKEMSYFVRSGIIQVNNETNEIQLHCLFADEVEKTVHTTVKEHLAWIHEQLSLGKQGVKNLGASEKTFLEKQGIAITQQLKHLERNTGEAKD